MPMKGEKKRVYHREYWIAHREKLKPIINNRRRSQHTAYREFAYRYKMRPCLDCGIQYNPWVMHFDHRDPLIKEFTIGRYKNLSEQEILSEIEKCDVVCSNCHAERTHSQRIDNPSGRIKI